MFEAVESIVFKNALYFSSPHLLGQFTIWRFEFVKSLKLAHELNMLKFGLFMATNITNQLHCAKAHFQFIFLAVAPKCFSLSLCMCINFSSWYIFFKFIFQFPKFSAWKKNSCFKLISMNFLHLLPLLQVIYKNNLSLCQVDLDDKWFFFNLI